MSETTNLRWGHHNYNDQCSDCYRSHILPSRGSVAPGYTITTGISRAMDRDIAIFEGLCGPFLAVSV